MSSNSKIEMMICYYGASHEQHSGIAFCQFKPDSEQFELINKIEIEGKVNFAIWYNNKVIVPSLLEEKSRISFYDFNEKNYHLTDFFDTSCFYSYGSLVTHDYGYFASFNTGENAVIDLKNQKEVTVIPSENGRSHYINHMNNGQILAIDNAFNKLSIYQDNSQALSLVRTLQFDDERPRLMAIHPSGKIGFLLMERTNQIVVLNLISFTEIQRIPVPNSVTDIDFCGGIAIDQFGKTLCVTVRHKNEIVLFSIDREGLLTFRDSQLTGDMPRDLFSSQQYYFVTCTNANKVEAFEVIGFKLRRVQADLDLDQPVTFVNKANLEENKC